MATRERIIEGSWSCDSCGKKGIPARLKNCPGCNNPREFGKESEFDYGGVAADGASTGESVTDEKALELARAGADWRCGYCHTANRGDKAKCRQCGAVRDEKAEVLEAVALDGPTVAQPPPPSGLARKLLLGLGAIVLLVGLAAFWATRTHAVTGTVSGLHWSHTVWREQFQKTAKQGWQDELHLSNTVMPVNGAGEHAGVEDISGCVRAQRGTRQVADGTQRVCHDATRQKQCGTEQKCTRTKMGNGFVKESCHDVPKTCSEHFEDCQLETRYRSEPIFANRCNYTTYEWRRIYSQADSGSTERPTWPSVSVSGPQRTTREEQYTVDVDYTRKGATERYTLHPATEQEFLGWPMGAPVKLEISNTGTVKTAVPAAAAR